MAFAVATAAATVYLWRLTCESFGCTGVGIAWAMGAGVLWLPGTLLSAALAVRSRPMRALFGVQLALAAVLGVHWLMHP